jgi:hypothetical protein
MSREFRFAVQVFLEERCAPLLLLWRRLVAGYPYRRIPLTQGQFALVDPEDYAELAKHKWCASRQSNTFYAVRSEHGRQIRMHRVVLHAPPGLVVDHINHDGRDNTKRNLRSCTKAENACNQRPQQGCSSQYIGVGRLKGTNKWYARIRAHGHPLWLGTFASERAAALARDAAAMAIYGPYTHLNFPLHKARGLYARLQSFKAILVNGIRKLQKKERYGENPISHKATKITKKSATENTS